MPQPTSFQTAPEGGGYVSLVPTICKSTIKMRLAYADERDMFADRFCLVCAKTILPASSIREIVFGSNSPHILDIHFLSERYPMQEYSKRKKSRRGGDDSLSQHIPEELLRLVNSVCTYMTNIPLSLKGITWFRNYNIKS